MDHKQVLTKLTTFLTNDVSLADYKPQLIENDLINERLIPTNLSAQDWTLAVLNQIRDKGPRGFTRLVEIFRENGCDEWIVERIEARCKALSQKSNGKALVDFEPPHKDYVERKELEKKCLEKLEKDNIIALTGMPGCGKSLLARRLGFLLKTDAENKRLPVKMIQLDCSSEQALENCLSSQSSQLVHITVERNLKHLLQNLAKEGLNVIIFDNMTSSVWVRDLLSEVPENAYWIMTSQNNHIFSEHNVVVNGLTEEEMYVLSQKIMTKNPLTKEDIHEFHEILNNVLGLITAFSQMENTETTAAEYLKIFKKRKIPFCQGAKEVLRDYDEPLYTVLEYAISSTKEELKSVSSAERILNVMAHLDRSNIPVEDIASALDKEDHEVCVIALIESLKCRSLVEVHRLNGKRVLKFNHVVQIVLYKCIGAEFEQVALDDTLSFLCHVCSKDTRFSKDYDMQLIFMPHIQSVLREEVDPSTSKKISTVLRLWLLLILGHFHTQQKRPAEARKLLDRALDEVSEKLLDYMVDFDTLARNPSEDQFKSICKKLQGKFDHDIQEFICSQRVSVETVKMWKSYFPDKWKSLEAHFSSVDSEFLMTSKQYVRLNKKGFALPLHLAKGYFLLELLASLLYTSGRVCCYKGKKASEKELQQSKLHLTLAKMLCEHIEREYLKGHDDQIGLLHTELVSRNGLLYLLLNEETFESAKKAKEEYESMLNNTIERFEFGLLKMTVGDLYRQLTYHRQIIRACRIMLSSTKGQSEDKSISDTERKIEIDALKYVQEQDSLIKDYEKDNHQVHSKASYWNEAGRLLLECRYNEGESLRQAQEYFLKACETEQASSSLNYPWLDAILGLITLFKCKIIKDDVLLDHLEKYATHVEAIMRKFPGNDYTDEHEKVQQLLKEQFKNLDRERRISIGSIFRRLQRSFSQTDSDSEVGSMELRGSSICQEIAVQDGSGDESLYGAGAEAIVSGDFGNIIEPINAEQHGQAGST